MTAAPPHSCLDSPSSVPGCWPGGTPSQCLPGSWSTLVSLPGVTWPPETMPSLTQPGPPSGSSAITWQCQAVGSCSTLLVELEMLWASPHEEWPPGPSATSGPNALSQRDTTELLHLTGRPGQPCEGSQPPGWQAETATPCPSSHCHLLVHDHQYLVSENGQFISQAAGGRCPVDLA